MKTQDFEYSFEPTHVPAQVIEKFLVFNCNAGYQAKATKNGIELSRRNKNKLVINHDDGKMNQAAIERYKLMLEKWFRDGRSTMDVLNVEVRKVYRRVAA